MSPCEALHGEILVDRADHDVLGLEQHLEIGIVGDRAAGGDRREPRAAPPAQHAVDLVAMDQRAAPTAPRGEAVGEHAQHRRIGLALKIAVRPSAPDEREQLGLAPSACALTSAAICWASTSSGASGMISRSSSPRLTLSISAAHSTRSSLERGNSRPFG